MASRFTSPSSVLVSLHPAYFAAVMATGILAIDCKALHLSVLSAILLALNLPAYALLWLLTIARVLRHTRSFLADLGSHSRAPSFFTTVAATAVIGVQLQVQMAAPAAALALWWTAAVLWLVLTYTVFTVLTVRADKPSLETGINGGWLTAVVATQSLVVLGALVAPGLGSGDIVPLTLVSLWLAGGMLYIWMISLIFYRYTFFRLAPEAFMPPYWINMGAMAISALAGTLLIVLADRSPLLTSMLPFLKGFTLLYWATATWWIPMLLALAAWRYVVRRLPLVYGPLYWGAVFPLAMYTSATFHLGEVFALPLLFTIARGFAVLALTAWLLTFLGLLLSIARRTLSVQRVPTAADGHVSAPTHADQHTGVADQGEPGVRARRLSA